MKRQILPLGWQRIYRSLAMPWDWNWNCNPGKRRSDHIHWILLAHDLGSGRPVIIENQLEATNHPHLGQLLTYASGYDAHVAVWIAKEFRDEHRQALDWLNQRSDENTEFFGVVIEVWKIDDSRPAPHFKLVATPNDWRKGKVTTKQEGATSERGEAYRVFFQES